MSHLPGNLAQLVPKSLSALRAAVTAYQGVCYGSSLGLESTVLTDLIWSSVPEINIFTIDTGRLFPETYDLIERQQRLYGRQVRIHYPEAVTLESWVASHGINGFRNSVEERQECCAVRKVEPFKRAIAGYGAWVTGIRRAQSPGRALAAPDEWDAAYCLHKISPLLDWNEEDIWTYIRHKRLPYQELHNRGFPSIGCAPCTRAVQPGESPRAGRWWWEHPEQRECGLHPRRQHQTPAFSATNLRGP